MPKFTVEGTSGGSDQRVIEASNQVEAIKAYLYERSGFGRLLNEYDDDSDPRGTYTQMYPGHVKKRWSRVVISISPAFEGCSEEYCDDEAAEDGLCWDHQPEEEEVEDEE